MPGLGLRREMLDWDLSAVNADFFEIAPENWIGRDRALLHALHDAGQPIHLHGVSLNLGGVGPLDTAFIRDVGKLMEELECVCYSDHLAASGDAHQLYDLFPIPFTQAQARRVGDRIRQVQDQLGRRIAIENSSWYTNIGDLREADFLQRVVDHGDCSILLDLNNIDVNHKNHGGDDMAGFVDRIDLDRVTYMHVAGHEFDPRFDMYIDTHSSNVAEKTAHMARHLHQRHGLAILLEWDNDVPSMEAINRELACLTHASPTHSSIT